MDSTLDKWLAQFNVIADIKPLSIGIKQDLINQKPEEIKEDEISEFLKRHTASVKYHEAIIDNKHRYDLTGTQCGTVTTSQRHYSRYILQRMESKKEKKSEPSKVKTRSRPTLTLKH